MDEPDSVASCCNQASIELSCSKLDEVSEDRCPRNLAFFHLVDQVCDGERFDLHVQNCASRWKSKLDGSVREAEPRAERHGVEGMYAHTYSSHRRKLSGMPTVGSVGTISSVVVGVSAGSGDSGVT